VAATNPGARDVRIPSRRSRVARQKPVSAAAVREDAVGGEGQLGEAFADAAVCRGVRVELVGQRQLGEVRLAVERAAVEVVQVRVLGRPCGGDARELVPDDVERQAGAGPWSGGRPAW
jgi:hypothetical protein